MDGLSNVALYATPQALQEACNILHQPRLCTTCQACYTEASNLGSHACYQHWGHSKNGRWTCCNVPLLGPQLSQHYPVDSMFNISINVPPYPPARQFRGCQPCDHTDVGQRWTYENTIRLHDVAGIIPYLNKQQPIDERSGFAVTTIDSQKLPVVLRCAKQWIQLPTLHLSSVYRDHDYYFDQNSYQFHSIRVHYLALGGQADCVTVSSLDLVRDNDGVAIPRPLRKFRGTTTSAFYVYTLTVDSDEEEEEKKEVRREQLVQIYEFINL